MAKRVLTDMEKEHIRKVQGLESNQSAEPRGDEEAVDMSSFQRKDEASTVIKPAALGGETEPTNPPTTPAEPVRKLDLENLDTLMHSMSAGKTTPDQGATSEKEDTAEKVPEPADTVEPEPSLRRPICPICGWDRSKALKAEPTKEDKLEFIRAVLGERPFEKSFPLFGGEVVLYFKEPTAAASTLLRMEMEKRVQLGRYKSRDSIGIAFIQLRTLASLSKLVRKEGKTTSFEVVERLIQALIVRNSVEVSDNGKTELENLEDKLFMSMPESLVRACAISLQKFEDILAVLGSRANDPDFYSGLTES